MTLKKQKILKFIPIIQLITVFFLVEILFNRKKTLV